MMIRFKGVRTQAINDTVFFPPKVRNSAHFENMLENTGLALYRSIFVVMVSLNLVDCLVSREKTKPHTDC